MRDCTFDEDRCRARRSAGPTRRAARIRRGSHRIDSAILNELRPAQYPGREFVRTLCNKFPVDLLDSDGIHSVHGRSLGVDARIEQEISNEPPVTPLGARHPFRHRGCSGSTGDGGHHEAAAHSCTADRAHSFPLGSPRTSGKHFAVQGQDTTPCQSRGAGRDTPEATCKAPSTSQPIAGRSRS